MGILSSISAIASARHPINIPENNPKTACAATPVAIHSLIFSGNRSCKKLPHPGFPRMGEKAIVYQFRFFLPIRVTAPRDRALRASRPAASSGKEESPVLGLVVSIFFHLA